MTRTALIMAGGRGERMARSGVGRPKPLVMVAGVTLLEWNLRMITRAGIDRVFVSVAADGVDVRAFVTGPLRTVGERAGVSVAELVEDRPLGNMGAVGLLPEPIDDVVVVFTDNLTGIDLGQIYDDHRAGDADLTLAAHREPFAMPFGELTADPGDPHRLIAYTEKPTYEPLVSSAVMVLGRAALDLTAPAPSMSIAQLAQGLVDEGRTVRLWPHQAPWVDVNDSAAVTRAEQLVALHPEVFGPADGRDQADGRGQAEPIDSVEPDAVVGW